MTFNVPMRVRCIQRTNLVMHLSADFGQIGEIYDVQAVVPNGCYYVLRHINGGDLLGQPGEVNHLVNMERFVPIQWMTENGIIDT